MGFDAHKSDIERYSIHYREFLDYWNKGIGPDHLEMAFSKLRGKAAVPDDVVALYAKTIAALRDTSAVDNTKRLAAEALYAAIDRLTMANVP